MKFRLDHDYHIHSYLSLCAADQNQTPKAILDKAKKMGYKKICLTDHFLDADVGFKPCFHPDFEWIKKALPLPKDEKVEFLFGCEAEMTYDGNVAVSSDKFDKFDFILIATTHMHITGGSVSEEQTATNLDRAKTWVWFLDRLFSMDMPFHKIGLAHFTCGLLARNSDGTRDDIINCISDAELKLFFTKSADLGIGIELNTSVSDSKNESALRPYLIAKECGCRFYLGSDAHSPNDFLGAQGRFSSMIDALELSEEDKFPFAKF